MTAFQNLPVWAKKAIIDFAEGAIVAVLALNFVIPSSLTEGKALALTVGAAIGGAAVAAIRRALPDAIAWLRDKTGTTE